MEVPTVAKPGESFATQLDAASHPQHPGNGKRLRALRERFALRRAYSTKLKHASLSSPTLLSPNPGLGVADEDESSEFPAPTKPAHARLTAFERFLNTKFGGARKGGKHPKITQELVIEEKVVAVDDLEPTPSNSSERSSAATEDALPTILEAEVNTTNVPAASEDEDPKPSTGDPAPEPLPLARKIQSLLSSLPPFLTPLSPSAPTSGPSHGPSEAPKTQPDRDTDPSAPAIDDSRLISLLSSPSIMNGSLSRGRQSVWALLDNLRLKSISTPPSPSGASQQAAVSSANAAEAAATIEDDDSVMFYGPLIPDATSEVELARSEIVSVDEDGTIVDVLLDDAPLPDAPTKMRFGGIWPFSGAAASRSASTPSPAPAKPKVLVEKRVWVPSTTKLSLQVMWWGFRLWLPPPVMNLLNDKEIEAAKLGAMLTGALQWLLTNVPESALPATLRPALALVRSLVPYLGYIGGFVAWSWGAIRGFDVGNGVTLTATWLLPIALIPGTWEDSDVPRPRPPPTPPTSGAPSSGADTSSPSPSPGGSSSGPIPGSNPPPSVDDPSTPAPNPSSPSGGSFTPAALDPPPPTSGSTTLPISGTPPASAT